MIERFAVDPVNRRDEWLALRRRDITASVAGALIGLHPYCTRFALWQEKSGLMAPEDEDSPAMERGRELEPIAVKRLKKLYHERIVRQPNMYFRDTEARLGCTPDCFVEDLPEEDDRIRRGLIQIKSVEPRIFAEQWAPDGTIEPPAWILVQAILEAHLTGASWCAVAALVIGHGIELHVIEVPIHAAIIERIKQETAEFWKSVEVGQPPEPDYAADAELIEKLYAKPHDVEVDLTSDNELPEAVAEYQNLGKSLAEIEALRKARRAEILHKLGDATAARIATGRITAKVIAKRAYVVPESTYRTIKFKEKT